jgi:hypothetical protein
MFNVAETDDSNSMAQPGSQGPSFARLNHFAFEYPTLEELFELHARLADAARQWRDGCRVDRLVPARRVTKPSAERWLTIADD